MLFGFDVVLLDDIDFVCYLKVKEKEIGMFPEAIKPGAKHWDPPGNKQTAS